MGKSDIVDTSKTLMSEVLQMKKEKMGLMSCILMGIGSIIGASVFASTPIAIKIVGGHGIVIGFPGCFVRVCA